MTFGLRLVSVLPHDFLKGDTFQSHTLERKKYNNKSQITIIGMHVYM